MKLLVLALSLSLIAMALPGTSAAESATEAYLAPGGVSAAGASAGAVVNQPSSYSPVGWPGWLGLPQGGVGGAHLRTSTFYNSVLLSANDDVFGSGTATAGCFWAFGGDDVCDSDQDAPSEAACGVHALYQPGLWRGATATVWVFAVFVSEDLDTCGGSQGRVTGDFDNR